MKLKNDVFTKWRNKKCSMIEVVQSYLMISTLLRNNINSFIMFPMRDKYSVTYASKDVVNMMDITEEEFKTWYGMINQDTHSFIMGVGNKGYISLEKVEDGKLKEYHFKDDEFDVANDEQIEEFMQLVERGTVTRQNVRRFKSYLKALSRSAGVSLESIVEQISDEYDVDLEID